MTTLTICVYRITTLVGFVSETARHCREFRLFCETLTIDCAKLVSDQKNRTLEFQFPDEGNERFSLTFFKRLAKGWEHSLAVQGSDNAILCIVQYQWRSGSDFVSRDLWGAQESLTSLAAGSPWQNISSQHKPILNRKLLSNVHEFQLYPIDVLGRKRERSLLRFSAGLECLVTFRSRYARQQPLTLHARIPLPRREYKRQSKDSSVDNQ